MTFFYFFSQKKLHTPTEDNPKISSLFLKFFGGHLGTKKYQKNFVVFLKFFDFGHFLTFFLRQVSWKSVENCSFQTEYIGPNDDVIRGYEKPIVVKD